MKQTDVFRQHSLCLGSFLSAGAPIVTEIASHYPFKWLLLDMEHGGCTESNIGDHLKALAGKEIMSIVRLPEVNPVLIGRVLDQGADGIMIPHVVSVNQIEACKMAMYYLPEGRRGFSSSTRQFSFGTNIPDDIYAIDKPLLFAQIEDVEGVLNSNEIAAVQGVDVLFVGPVDLKLDLKYHSSGGLNYDKALEMVANAAKSNNKKAGILIRDRQLLGQIQQMGYTCIAIDSDIAILRAGYESIIKDFEKSNRVL